MSLWHQNHLSIIISIHKPTHCSQIDLEWLSLSDMIPKSFLLLIAECASCLSGLTIHEYWWNKGNNKKKLVSSSIRDSMAHGSNAVSLIAHGSYKGGQCWHLPWDSVKEEMWKMARSSLFYNHRAQRFYLSVCLLLVCTL